MFDPKLYREACTELTLPPETWEEMIAMTEQNPKKVRPARVALATATLVAALGITASAANLPPVQEILTTVKTAFCVTVTSEGDDAMNGFIIPDMDVAEREGHVILTVDEEEVDITDPLAQEGSYTYHKDCDDFSYDVIVDESKVPLLKMYDAEGNETLSIVQEGNKEDTSLYTVTTDDEDGEDTPSITVFNADEFDSYNYDTEVPE